MSNGSMLPFNKDGRRHGPGNHDQFPVMWVFGGSVGVNRNDVVVLTAFDGKITNKIEPAIASNVVGRLVGVVLSDAEANKEHVRVATEAVVALAPPPWGPIAANEGDAIYVDGVGNLTNADPGGTRPVGVVLSDDGVNAYIGIGNIYVAGLSATAGLALALDDLTDVSAPAPADGQVLRWNSGSGAWEPHTLEEINVAGSVYTYTEATPASTGMTVDLSLARTFILDLTALTGAGNYTITFSNEDPGVQYRLFILDGAVATRTLVWTGGTTPNGVTYQLLGTNSDAIYSVVCLAAADFLVYNDAGTGVYFS